MGIGVVHGGLLVTNICNTDPYCKQYCNASCNSWALAYPHFHRCGGASDCAAQASLNPIPHAVCPVVFVTACVYPSTAFGVGVKSCGPAKNQDLHVSTCSASTYPEAIACANTTFMASLLNKPHGHSTRWYGHAKVKISFTT